MYLTSPSLPHRAFLHLHLTFRAAILYEVIVVRGIRLLSRLVFLACGCPVVATSFWLKDCPFSTNLSFLLLQKSTHCLCGFVSGLSVLICLSILLSVPHCLGYWSLRGFLEVRNVSFSNSSLGSFPSFNASVSLTVLWVHFPPFGSSGSFILQCNPYNQFLIFTQLTCWNFGWDFVDHIDSFGKN